MKEKNKIDFLSLIMAILIIVIIGAAILFSLDFLGIISLPEKLSLKTYFPNLEEIVVNDDTEDEFYRNINDTTIVDDSETKKSTYSLDDFVDATTSDTTKTTTYDATDNSYFYNQLDSYGKTVYTELYANLDSLKTGTATIDFGKEFNDLLQTSGGEQTLTDAFQLSINALLMDHPEIFYLDVGKIYMYTEATKTIFGTTYNVSIGPASGSNYLAEGFKSENDVLSAEAELKATLKTIMNKLSGTTYDKIKQVHNYLIDNTTYDSNTTSDLSHGIYGTLVNHLAVCDGYSKSFKYILDSIGISCVEVCGTAQNTNGQTENHAWNDVLIDGVWYGIDVTWDDPIIIGNGTLTEDLRYGNFLKGSNSFYKNHHEDGYIVSNGSFYYPTLSTIDY